MQKEFFYYNIIPAALTVVILFVFVKTLKFTLPFILASIVVVLIAPVVEFLYNRRRVPKVILIFSLLAIFYSILFGAFYLGARKVIKEMKNAIDVAVQYMQGKEFVLPENLTHYLDRIDDYLAIDKSQLIQGGAGNIMGIAQKIQEVVLSVLANLPQITLVVIVMVIASFFMLKERDVIKKIKNSVFTGKWQDFVHLMRKNVTHNIFGYIKAQLILISVNIVIITTGFSLLGIKYPITLGAITGAMDILPIFGPGAVLIPMGIVNIVLGKTKIGLLLFLLYGIVYVNRQFLEPRLLALSFRIPAIIALSAIYIGYQLMGVLGVLFGPIFIIFHLGIRRTMQEMDLLEVLDRRMQQLLHKWF